MHSRDSDPPATGGTPGHPTRRAFLQSAAGFAAASAGLGLFGYGRVARASAPAREVVRPGLSRPHGVAIDADGRVYVADSGNYRIQVLSPDLNPLGLFGKPGYGPGRLNFPTGIDIGPDGLLYIADANNGRICRFTTGGDFVDDIGSLGGTVGCFYTPQAVRTGADGRIVVANTRGHNVQTFDPATLRVTGVWGVPGYDSEQIAEGDLAYGFRLPTDCAVLPDGRVWVLDSRRGAIVKLVPDGGFQGRFSLGGSAEGELNRPQAMAFAGGFLYVCDTGNGQIVRFDGDGRFVAASGDGLHEPTGVAVTDDGRVLVADARLSAVVVLEGVA